MCKVATVKVTSLDVKCSFHCRTHHGAGSSLDAAGGSGNAAELQQAAEMQHGADAFSASASSHNDAAQLQQAEKVQLGAESQADKPQADKPQADKPPAVKGQVQSADAEEIVQRARRGPCLTTMSPLLQDMPAAGVLA